MPIAQPLKVLTTAAALALAAATAPAQSSPPSQAQSDPRAVAAVRAAVASQIEADRNDHTDWIYLDHDITPDHDNNLICVGSPGGELRRIVRQHGQPVTPDLTQSENDRINAYVNDPAAQARNHKNQAHDDVQATALLKMLPDSFLWSITSDTPEFLALAYRPDPGFAAPNMESRVFAAMAGTLVIVHKGNLIRSFTGTLTDDIKIGYGLLGHLNKGGTIDIERRDVGTGHWEITETHVHIGGHVLFFKSIGTSQDETKTDWRPSPAKSLQEAQQILRTLK